MKILSEKKIEKEYQAYSNIIAILYYDSNSIVRIKLFNRNKAIKNNFWMTRKINISQIRTISLFSFL